jgi:hypothetical protein
MIKPAALLLSALLVAPSLQSQETKQLPDTEPKSVGQAVLLSYLFPGAGSIYAGNTKRGVIHLTAAFVGAVAFASALGDTHRCESFGCQAKGAIAIGGLFLNIPVSMVTAAVDANHFNEQLEHSTESSPKPSLIVGPSGRGLNAGFSLPF